MTLPTPEQLDAEADRRYRLRDPGATADAAPGLDAATWLEVREEVLSEWTAAVFDAFFPTAGDLGAGDTVLIQYWDDIKQQISGGVGRWSWDGPPFPAP